MIDQVKLKRQVGIGEDPKKKERIPPIQKILQKLP
jgi:hypothetical protein